MSDTWWGHASGACEPKQVAVRIADGPGPQTWRLKPVESEGEMSDIDLRANLDEALDALEECVQQVCSMPDGKPGEYESAGLSIYADAMRLLSKHGRFHITKEFSRMVFGRFIPRAERAKA